MLISGSGPQISRGPAPLRRRHAVRARAASANGTRAAIRARAGAAALAVRYRPFQSRGLTAFSRAARL